MVCYRSVEFLIFHLKLPAEEISIDFSFSLDEFMIWDLIRHIFLLNKKSLESVFHNAVLIRCGIFHLSIC
jgi:hypothetical protein